MTLIMSHRTIGAEVARATTADGAEIVVLRTAFGRLEAVPAASARAASPEAVAFAARMAMADAVQQCIALGLDADAIEALARQVAEAQ
jgi:hypothetical protein